MKTLDKLYKKVVAYLANMCYPIIKIVGLGVNSMNKYSALDIATWFIYKTNAEKKENQAENDTYEVYEGLTHLKLQKLLYYAQGICLSLSGKTLFDEPIEAWDHGPVVKKVFDRFTSKGRNEITIEDAPSSVEVIRQIESDTVVREALNLTYDNFAIYTAWQLRNMTHEIGSPWSQIYVHGKNKRIPNNVIRDYFNNHVME